MVHVAPASVVLKMRDAGPLPMLSTYAVCASIASMSRKSSVSVVTVNFFQVAPPSLVRSTVAPDPLAHATRSLTALTPRKRAVTPLVCNVQRGPNMANAGISNAATNKIVVFIRLVTPNASQTSGQFRSLRESALAVSLAFADRFLVTLVLRPPLASRNYVLIRADLTRATGLHAWPFRDTAAGAHVKLRRLQHHRSSCWTSYW